MRCFYIFKIKKEMTILTKDIPYNLYKSIDTLYYLDNTNLDLSFRLFNEIFDKFDVAYLNKKVIETFKDNRFYSYEDGVHKIDNKYKPELSYLKVFKTHILIKSDAIHPTFLINYLMSDNLFVCDFKNKDYFWLNEFVR